jgi:hypothetical protein
MENSPSTCCLVSVPQPMGRYFEFDVGHCVTNEVQFRMAVNTAPYKYPLSLSKYVEFFHLNLAS